MANANSFWNEKPSWCQPWSIILTGITLFILSWVIFRVLWISLIIILLVIIWWFLFLYLVPTLYLESIEETIDND